MYAGVYRDGTGWGQAATDCILALDAVGVDVVPRAVKLNGVDHRPPPRVLELERKSARGCDVVVQHVLPHLFDYNGRMLNVGMFATETSDFRATTWAERANLMDRVVVFNRQSAAACRASGVTAPVAVVPHACDVARFDRSYPPLDRLRPHKEAGEFLFYTVGEFVKRKNLSALLKAYHLEFDPSEPVRLVIKTSQPGRTPAECEAAVRDYCVRVKAGLKLHGGRLDAYAEEIVVADRLTDEGVMRLHAACDVFVQPSFGEAWSQPAFDAMGLGKTPVVTACAGYLDYLSDAEGWLVDCRPEPCFGATDALADLAVGTEAWWAADVSHLRRCMRQAYGRADLRADRARNGAARAHDFSYEVVGRLLAEALADGRQALDETPRRLLPAGPGGPG